MAAKRPSKISKHELKEILEGLKKDATLILARKALRCLPSYLKSTGLTKKLVKEMIRLWAGSHEKIRVICLLCLIRLFRKQPQPIKEMITKRMYTSYNNNINIKTNTEAFPLLVFMRQSLVEIYSLDPALAYKQGFLFCKQLASTLKNAYENKIDTYKTVYNWQFLSCLTLWSNLVASLMPHKHIEPLVNPVIQLHMGTLNLISSPRYHPMYLHLIANLVHISVKLDVFIPVLPLLNSILDRLKVNQNNKSSKKESFNFDVLIHVSESEIQSRLYFDATSDRVYQLMVKYLASQCHRIAFPELCLISKVQIKKFVKENKKESGKFRNLLTKLEENIKFIEDRRQTVDFAFTNFAAIDAWEKATKDTGRLALVKLASEMQIQSDISNAALKNGGAIANDDSDDDDVGVADADDDGEKGDSVEDVDGDSDDDDAGDSDDDDDGGSDDDDGDSDDDDDGDFEDDDLGDQ